MVIPTFNKYGFIIAGVIIINILIFSFMSRRLNHFIAEGMERSYLENLE
jgi:hypothetical protein